MLSCKNCCSNKILKPLLPAGFSLSKKVLSSIVRRYGGRDMKLTFNDFVIVLTKIMVHMGKFKFMLIVVSSAVLIKQGTTVYGKGMSHQIRFKTIA